MDVAVEDHLKKNKLFTTPYNAERAHSEFPFISTSFTLSGKANPTEHEGGGGSHDHTGFLDTPHCKSQNTVMLHISVPAHLHEPPRSNPTSTKDSNINSTPQTYSCTAGREWHGFLKPVWVVGTGTCRYGYG